MPTDPSWGALVRYVWNAAAVVQMFCHRIPWGGSLALKTEVFRRCDLLDRWGNAFCEDTMLFGVLRKLGLRVAFVPSLMMVNREGCGMGDFFDWMRRQMLTARLYHPRWWAVMGHGAVTSVPQACALFVLLAALITRQGAAVAWVGAGLACYLASMVVMLALMERAIGVVVRSRGESTRWLSPVTVVRIFAAIPVTQAMYAVALVSAMLLRHVRWRGVCYRIEKPLKIYLVQDRPWDASELSSEGNASL